VALIAGFRRALPVFRYMIVVAVAVVMWESRRDFQGVWEGWKAGFMAFHAFHTPSFPRRVFGRFRNLAFDANHIVKFDDPEALAS
jgi:hypothetical protein